MSRKTPAFVTLEKAFWIWVERHCPHPLQSRHRYTWVRDNLFFEHEGVIYERCSTAVKTGAGERGAYVVSYRGDDGSVIEDWREGGAVGHAA